MIDDTFLKRSQSHQTLNWNCCSLKNIQSKTFIIIDIENSIKSSLLSFTVDSRAIFRQTIRPMNSALINCF